MSPDPTIRAALEAAERETTTAGKVAAFLRALPRDWREIMRHETQWRIPAITGWSEDTTRDGPDTAAHWHAWRLAAAVEEAARDGI